MVAVSHAESRYRAIIDAFERRWQHALGLATPAAPTADGATAGALPLPNALAARGAIDMAYEALMTFRLGVDPEWRRIAFEVAQVAGQAAERVPEPRFLTRAALTDLAVTGESLLAEMRRHLPQPEHDADPV